MLGGMDVTALPITTGMDRKARTQEGVLVMKLIAVKILDTIIGLGCFDATINVFIFHLYSTFDNSLPEENVTVMLDSTST